MKKSAKKMIDAGQISKKPATKVKAAFPSKKFSTKIQYAGNTSEDFGTKVKAFPINLLKKEEAVGGVEEEAINGKMKLLEIKKKAAGDITEFASRFRVEIRGFDTKPGADLVEVAKALREHFGKCGRIKGITVDDRCAYIDFASIDSLKKALELDNTRVGGYRVAVMQPEINNPPPSFTFRGGILPPGVKVRTSRLRALVSWSGVDVIELEPHFEKCGEIAEIHYTPSRMCAWIDFTNEDSLNKALNLHNTEVDNHTITVRKYNPSSGSRLIRKPSYWRTEVPPGYCIFAGHLIRGQLVNGPALKAYYGD